MNNYHDKQASPKMNSQFQKCVLEQGWRVHREGTLGVSERDWIEDFESLPPWLACSYNEDIFEFNRESYGLWERWKQDDPELFNASLLREGIVRLFSDPTTFKNKAAVQQRLGGCRRVLSLEEIAREHPALAEAVDRGYLAGGLDEVGFTVRAHEFMRQLLDRLARAGATFAWNKSADSLAFASTGTVKGIQTDGHVIEDLNYVISPGVYGNGLLDGTRSRGQIHGVLGVWLTIPNIEPRLANSLKLRRTGHITEAANITISRDLTGAETLVIGSGYGHTGIDPHNIDTSLLEEMYVGLIDTAQKYFRTAYDAAVDVHDSFKYCVRPWTSTGLGIFETLLTESGGKCVITGGHNTGGFAQAPAVAQAVLAALEGQQHAMHHRYHPCRASTFLFRSGSA